MEECPEMQEEECRSPNIFFSAPGDDVKEAVTWHVRLPPSHVPKKLEREGEKTKEERSVP